VAEDRLAAIRELTRRAYEDPRIVSRYMDVGLWPAEEILVLEYMPDNAKVLDIGCGGGRTAIALAELGLDVYGIDISKAMIALARQQTAWANLRGEFQVMDVMNMEFPANVFDVAFFPYNGIELLPGMMGKKQAIKEIWRVLKPGGVFIFSSHSMVALNALAPARMKTFIKFCLGRFLGLPVREQELGERFIDDEWEEAKYLQILPPFLWTRLIRQAGFEMKYFNSRRRLEKDQNWGIGGHFEDGERFYVAVKKAS
jgi:SAM-dependent methyltransferase